MVPCATRTAGPSRSSPGASSRSGWRASSMRRAWARAERPTRWTPTAAWSRNRASRNRCEKLGLLPPEAGGRTTAVLEVRDPGDHADRGGGPDLPAEDLAADLGGGRRGGPDAPASTRTATATTAASPWWGRGSGCPSGASASSPRSTGTKRTRRSPSSGGPSGCSACGLLLVAAAIALSSLRIYSLQKKVDAGRAPRAIHARGQDRRGGDGRRVPGAPRVPAPSHRGQADPLGSREPGDAGALRARGPAHGQLTHPNTIAIYDYGRTPEGIFYYAMEYLPGLPLDQVIQGDGAQPEARVVHLLKQICASLAEAHRDRARPSGREARERDALRARRRRTTWSRSSTSGSSRSSAPGTTPGDGRWATSWGRPSTWPPRARARAANGGPAQRRVRGGRRGLRPRHRPHVFTGNSGVEIIGHHLHSAPVPPSERLGRR